MFRGLQNLKIKSIVVMPDFFVDRIIRLDSKEEFFKVLTDKIKFGGGSIRGIPTVDRKGGNAVNVAYCLAKLGANPTLLTIADELGSAMLQKVFSKFGDSVNLKIRKGKHGRTTGLEFLDKKGTRANVMINDLGDNENFGPDRIESGDELRLLKEADAVMVVNWASNSKGTDLANFVFENSPTSFHYIDPADIETRKDEFRDALFVMANKINSLSLNENEANSLRRSLGIDSPLPLDKNRIDELKIATRELSSKTGINIDLHTSLGVVWSNGKETEFVRAMEVKVETLTGAGDSWDAANIIGYLSGLNPYERLIFSNAYASLYVGNPYGEPATMNETIELLERIPSQ